MEKVVLNSATANFRNIGTRYVMIFPVKTRARDSAVLRGIPGGVTAEPRVLRAYGPGCCVSEGL